MDPAARRRRRPPGPEGPRRRRRGGGARRLSDRAHARLAAQLRGGDPGGLFAPLLAVGAVRGGLVQGILSPILPATADAHGSIAIVGMTAPFAAVVRAPFTGVALLVERTATTSLVVPMLAASFAAVLVTTLVQSPPIYDSLRERINPLLRNPGGAGSPVT